MCTGSELDVRYVSARTHARSLARPHARTPVFSPLAPCLVSPSSPTLFTARPPHAALQFPFARSLPAAAHTSRNYASCTVAFGQRHKTHHGK